MQHVSRFAVAIVFVGSLVACSLNSTPPGSGHFMLASGEYQPQIISDRPINKDRSIFTIKLTNPALLEAAVKTDDGLRIPADAIKAINAEQETVIAALKSAVPEVQILYRYRMILNGLAFAGPASLEVALRNMNGIRVVEPSRKLGRPTVMATAFRNPSGSTFTNTSVSFIEATEVHRQLRDKSGEPIRGQGIRVGVIDTGIDFTHRMLGGSGREDDFKNTPPDQPAAAFPNRKVVGGIDLVGTDYDAASELWSRQLPRPDQNPIDEDGHGTHVAGTIAGIGDGTETYSGVAPDADLFAIKVFGSNGSTADFVVVAALEYAADPNGDGNPDDKLDVVNLSLGGGFGQPQTLYTEAVRNLTRGGTVVVASAGNSGAFDYIVGSPSTADDAFSVAASVDDMPHNWTFPAVQFSTIDQPDWMVRAIEGPVSRPIRESDAKGKLIFIGLANRPLTDEEQAALKGNVALIDRGQVPFIAKLKLAESAGAIGAVVANNQPGDPIPMGGEGSVGIPAIMVTKEVGDVLKAAIAKGDATIVFNTGRTIEDPRLIDTITDFSSKGPRSIDSLLKPEVTAPGENIISAAMGTGDKGVKFSGTSMSGPHVAGVMALLKQHRDDLSVAELKSLVMSTTKLMNNEAGKVYPLSMQGAGRVRTLAAATAPLTFSPVALSLGNIQVGQSKTLRREVTVRNTLAEAVTVQVAGVGADNLTLQVGGQIHLEPGQVTKVPVLATVNAVSDQAVVELNGAVKFTVGTSNRQIVQRLPVLAIATRISDISASQLMVHAATEADSPGALAQFQVQNRGRQPGIALPFNLIGYDSRKPRADVTNSFRSRSCDLESAGYRIVRKVVDGEDREMLQFAVKTYEPTTTWHYCEVSIQIDGDGDDLADQELVGIARSNLSGVDGLEFSSLLLDAAKAREIRLAHETELAAGKEAPLSYVDAVLDLQPMRQFDHSTVAIVEAPLELITRRKNGLLAVKVATLYADTNGLEPDDFLGGQLRSWHKLAAEAAASGFYEMPEEIHLAAGETRQVSLTRGSGRENLIVYLPTNSSARSVSKDPQAIELKKKLVAPISP